VLKEFRDFIARGNVIDLAVGIIIGAAFTAIVTSLVEDLINPLIGLVTGGLDFSTLFFVLGEGDYPSVQAARDAGASVFAYGNFITAVIKFLIIAWVVFLLIKAVNAVTRKKEAPPPPPPGPTELDLLKEIRDALKR
jgi:large conductance mechanosensitive channel